MFSPKSHGRLFSSLLLLLSPLYKTHLGLESVRYLVPTHGSFRYNNCSQVHSLAMPPTEVRAAVYVDAYEEADA